MTQKVQTLDALGEDQGSVPSALVTAHSAL